MSEVSKVHTGPSIQSNVTHVEGVESSSILYYKGCNALYVESVESSSIYTIRAVMLCMSKVSKEVQNGLTHLCL